MPDDLPEWTRYAKPGLTVLGLVILWTWETALPVITTRRNRWLHAGRNLTISLLNTIVLALLFGAATVGIAVWTEQQQIGLLNWFNIPQPWRLLLAIVLLDGWLYTWHRLNHSIRLLWLFHRMHHSDNEMDVTSATRFHLGEHLSAATLRLGLIPLFGVTAFEILVFETLVVAATMFHHANISLGWFDRPLRWVLVTPRMHHIHHSRFQPETDSNFSVLFSFWDRLAGTYRMRSDQSAVELGLDDFDDDQWQSIAGMLRTPFKSNGRADNSPIHSEQHSSKTTTTS